MRRRWKLAMIAPIALAALALFVFLLMSLWNWLVPAVFGGHTITYWQALGIFVLSKLLFGGFHGRPGHRRRWRARMRARWEKMTPEERERFIQGIDPICGRRGGFAPEAGESGKA